MKNLTDFRKKRGNRCESAPGLSTVTVITLRGTVKRGVGGGWGGEKNKRDLRLKSPSILIAKLNVNLNFLNIFYRNFSFCVKYINQFSGN